MSQTEKAPAAPAEAAAASAKPEENQEKLSIESIGWLFIQKYYSTYTTEAAKLFAFYDKEASLLHDEFPSVDHATTTVHLASGSDAIKKHFAAQAQADEKNKIVVEKADFQKSVNNSILIVVCGFWKKGASDLLQFVQTFVLKAKEQTVYDVSNDLLKFIDFSDRESKVVQTEAEPSKETEAAAPEEAEPKTEVKEAAAPVEEKPVEAKAAQPAEKPAEQPAKVPKPSQEQEQTQESESAEKPVAEKEASETKKPASSDEKSGAPSQKPTWANLAAIEPQGPKAPASSSPTTAKPTAVPAKKSASPAQPTQPTQPANGKFKKDEWYPIYIRNIEVEEDELKNALISTFGDIKFFKKSNKAALCDFRNKEDQQKALQAKEIVVKTNVILLEPRVHKPFNGKNDFKKEKKQVKKNGVKKN